MEPQAGALLLRFAADFTPADIMAPAAAEPRVPDLTSGAEPSLSFNGGSACQTKVHPETAYEGVVMRGYRTGLVASSIVLAMTAAAVAQEGHPLVGSWHGDRGVTAKARTDVTLIMDYDGAQITGVVNPGFENMRLQNATLTPKDWMVHFELDAKDASGKPTHCSVDGKIERLGSDQRTLAGTWVCGTMKETFKLTRDRDYTR